ncbi:MAG: hypothetical protein E4H13_04745 [Calditrichales bacterium]|nr:MAG: hypothetical protein E4H13_04745 [Calditrichales bacterium]
MISQKYITLMQKEIDQEISTAEKAMLSDYLSDNPEADGIYQQLLFVEKKMSQVEQIEAPPELKSNIIKTIDHSRYEVKRADTTSVFTWRLFLQKRRVHMTFAVAAGLVLGLVLYPLIGYPPEEDTWGTVEAISGTIGIYEAVDVHKTQSNTIKTDNLSGSIDIRQSRTTIGVFFNISAREEFDTRLKYNPEVLTFSAIQPQDASDIIFHHDRGTINIKSAHAFVLLFSRKVADRCDLNVSFSADGKPLQWETYTID